MDIFICILVSYFIGSIPYGLLLVKIFKGVDIRTVGSKNIGATNVLRAGYKTLAVFTLLFDLLKGVFAVFIFQKIYVMEMGYLAGMFAILGHNFSVWLKFKGGKGVATSLGTICAVNPLIGFLAITTWLLFAFLFKYSSLAAILSFLSTNIYAYLLYKNSQEFIILISFTIFIAMLVVITHRKNILRLIKQEETKIKF